VEVVINPSVIGGSLFAPASKSSMQRAVAAALLADGVSTLVNPSYSSDSIASLEMARCLGATITTGEDRVLVKGGFNPQCTSLDCHESGLGVRLFSSIAALSDRKILITGRGSVMLRPMEEGFECLRSAGAGITSNGGKLPVEITGPLKGGEIVLDGTSTSQFLTGLLMALPTLENDSRIDVINLASRQYIDLTMDVMSRFGVKVQNDNYRRFSIPGKQSYSPVTYYVEGDWSGSSFILAMGAIGGCVAVRNLDKMSAQPDREIITFLRNAGAVVDDGGDIYCVSRGNLKGFSADISGCPDLAPPLVALASYCKGKTILRGTSRLSIKESDRGKTLESEFRKIGVEITNHGDSIEIEGGRPLKGGRVSANGDHRIAMALAVAAAGASGEIIIEEAESVNKSYPGFFEDFSEAGGSVKLI